MLSRIQDSSAGAIEFALRCCSGRELHSPTCFSQARKRHKRASYGSEQAGGAISEYTAARTPLSVSHSPAAAMPRPRPRPARTQDDTKLWNFSPCEWFRCRRVWMARAHKLLRPRSDCRWLLLHPAALWLTPGTTALKILATDHSYSAAARATGSTPHEHSLVSCGDTEPAWTRWCACCLRSRCALDAAIGCTLRRDQSSAAVDMENHRESTAAEGKLTRVSWFAAAIGRNPLTPHGFLFVHKSAVKVSPQCNRGPDQQCTCVSCASEGTWSCSNGLATLSCP
jgi:hypothetical protein